MFYQINEVLIFLQVLVNMELVYGTTTIYCPLRFPYPYFGGRFCCRYNLEKASYEFRTVQDALCDGSALTSESECCKDDQYIKCSGSTCQTPVFENDPCTEDHPYPYFHGLYCCKTKQEKTAFVHQNGRPGCQNNVLSLTSECCENDDFIECTNPPCVEMGYWSLTWNAEGNDNSADAKFSRRARLNSIGGIVIGKGYEISGHFQAAIETKLKSVGVSDNDASQLSLGQYLYGQQAQQFVNSVQGIVLTHKQQLDLFIDIRDEEINTLKQVLKTRTPPVDDFDSLHSTIKGILLDLQMTKQYSGAALLHIHPAVSQNDVISLLAKMSDRSAWLNVEQNRFDMRVAYVQKGVDSL